MEAFNEVIQRDPTYASAYRMRAAARMAGRDAAGAVDDLKRVVEMRPKDATAYFLLGQAHRQLTQATEATRAFCMASTLGLSKAKPLCPKQATERPSP